MWYCAAKNKSNLLTELTGSSIAKTTAGLPIQGCVLGAVRSKVNSDWSAKHHQRTINSQETLILVRDISVKYGVIALYGKQIDPGRNALYIYGIKCSTDEKGNVGNELITKKSTVTVYNTHTSFQAVLKIWFIEFQPHQWLFLSPMQDPCTLILALQDSTGPGGIITQLNSKLEARLISPFFSHIKIRNLM